MKVTEKGKSDTQFITVEKFFFYPDIHFPFHDETALNSAHSFCKDFNPDVVVQLGDLLDCYALSSYDKDPSRILTLQTEVDMGIAFWEKVKEMCPNAELHYKQGNHEERWQRTIYKKPELFPLRALKFENIMELDRLGVKYTDAKTPLFFHNALQVTHGHFVRGAPGTSGLAELAARGFSGISGHVHRAAKVTKPLGGKLYSWVESGHLGSKTEGFEYMGDITPNWQHAVTVGYMYHYGDNDWQVKLDLVEADKNGNFYYNNKFYTPQGVISYV